MHWPLLTNHKLEANECHVLVIRFPEKISHKIDAKQARMILIESILKDYTQTPFHIETTGAGKPYLDTAEVHFNISHSQDILVLAISHFPVGIDFEFIKKKDYQRFSSYFWESDVISVYPKYMQALAFFQAWTQTEAWVKYHGDTIFNHHGFTPHRLLSRDPITLTSCKIVSFMPYVHSVASLCYDKRIDTIKLKQLHSNSDIYV